jgi:transcription elongation GreA/GreB family factor
MSKLKQQLYLLCVEYVKNNATEIKKAIEEAQEAANDETKSSAGDKFETGRETIQQDIDLNLVRMNELNKVQLALERIMPDQTSDTVQPGCVVRTNNGSYYVAIGAGKLNVEGTTYYAISIASPIGAQLAGKKAGDDFDFNGKHFVIEKVS